MSLTLPRRSFLGALVGLIAAPAIVRASSIMPISAPRGLTFRGIPLVFDDFTVPRVYALYSGYDVIWLDPGDVVTGADFTWRSTATAGPAIEARAA